MPNIVIDKKEELVMKIIHYFVTEENYRPIIVNGVQNEIWLENLDNEIPIIRINTNYIHNNEQLAADQRKASLIRKSIKKKTFSLKLSMLNILINARDGVEAVSDKNIESVVISKITDLKKNNFVNEYFPKFKEKVVSKKADIESMISMTDELNEKTTKEDRKLAKIFVNKEKPIVTYLLIALNIIIYLLTLLDYPFMINTFANYYVNIQKGELYRLLTCAFLHANIFHIFFNMYALYNIGILIERYYGKAKYLIIYLGSALIGSLFSAVLTNNVSVGASGAIFGLFGSMVYFGYKYRATLDGFLRSGIIPVILANLILGFLVPSINVWAHIGGLIGGFLLSYTVGVVNKSSKKEKTNGIIITCILVTVLIYMLMSK